MKKNSLKNLLKEYILREGGETSIKSDVSENSSLDAQVDKLLIAYESEAKNLKKEGYDFRSLTRRILLEKDEDPKEDKEPKKDEDVTTEKLPAEDIDVMTFAASVVRLIDNYDNLLEVRDTLIRRSRDFLKKNYSDDVVSNFLSVLRDQYDVEVGLTDIDKKYELKIPDAAGAGPSPGGG